MSLSSFLSLQQKLGQLTVIARYIYTSNVLVTYSKNKYLWRQLVSLNNIFMINLKKDFRLTERLLYSRFPEYQSANPGWSVQPW